MDFYIKASKVIAALDAKQGSIKGLTLQSGDKNGPRTYALVLETLKYRQALEQVIKQSSLLQKERKLAAQGPLALVLVHDLLLNKAGIVSNAGLFKDAVLRHKTRLHAEWVKAKIKLKAKDNQSLAKRDETFIPRWARVNTLKTSMEAVLDSFGCSIAEKLEQLVVGSVYIDTHIQNLLAFHPDETLSKHKHYLDGSLIFQNKASCIPAAILAPPEGAHVVDACAAPGNKTSHLAALLQGSGKLFAFERDPRRVQVLSTMLAKAGADCTVAHQDFSRANPKDAQYAKVTHLLLDPSCSGSGIVNRLDYLTEQDGDAENVKDEERLESLASFQLALLLHALTFPAAEKVTYSTCSVHAIENEGVVMAALAKRPDWQVAPRAASLPSWPRRGDLAACGGDMAMSEGLVRAMPGEHGTIGFFVATFIRRTQETPEAPLLKNQLNSPLTKEDLKLLQHECDLLTLLHHRNKNQHGSAVWFRHLASLKSALARVLSATQGQPQIDACLHLLDRCRVLFLAFSQIIGTGQYVALGSILVGLLARCWRIVDVRMRSAGFIKEDAVLPADEDKEADLARCAADAGKQVLREEMEMGVVVERASGQAADGRQQIDDMMQDATTAASSASASKTKRKKDKHKQKLKLNKRGLSAVSPDGVESHSGTKKLKTKATKSEKTTDASKDEIDDIFG